MGIKEIVDRVLGTLGCGLVFILLLTIMWMQCGTERRACIGEVGSAAECLRALAPCAEEPPDAD